ncbi:chemotaxis protein CheA [Allopontixanthobacter sediminis]|uniref:Chemotaxis protein CheA n=1 Tax=Allopontixanthobacter sediminis TaxID=1689985 RepID=A0A845B3R7_9SPHN|nr:chemotaxis protein CheA [Allopontixanthobacter sediminis]MXP45030.1 chemotaxis protein CheA [Allopontixanthobacter sediminis]
MDDLLAEFVAETREMLEAIEGEIVAWEADPDDRARLDSIFRFVHTVKGNCGFFDYPELESLSHAAESALAEVRAGRRVADFQLVNGVLAIIDRIGRMTAQIENGDALNSSGDDLLIAMLDPDSEEHDEPQEIQATESTPAKPSTPAATPRSIRLPVDLLDRVMSGVSDMVLARNDLARRLRASGSEPSIDGPFERLSGILNDVREATTRMRMQRIEYLYNPVPRLVRDLSAELGKQVMVDLEGEDAEMDREMIEMIRDPVTHIIRNAIDHGLETPAERRAAGKHEVGLLGMTARQSGNRISIAISDDGRGLDCARLGAKAVAAGLLTEAQVAEMSREDLHQLIFEPGLSTAEVVSEVSGRGVGMDVVRANLDKIGGTITVRSTPGEGTVFILAIPLTLSIVAGLTVAVGDQRFAVPRSYVEEIMHGAASSLEFSSLGDADLVTFRGRRIPCLSLARVLNLRESTDLRRETLLLIRLGTGDLFALAVDRVFDHEDLVVKPLAPAVMATGIYAGTTLLDDGSPILMLDVQTIAAQNGLVSEVRVRPSPPENANRERAVRTRPVMLFTGMDGRRRAIAMDLVRRIDVLSSDAVDIEGSRSQIVIEGSILPLIGLDDRAGTGTIPEGKLKLLRLSDGQCELAYAVSDVSDASAIENEIVPSEDDPLIEGVTMIGGYPTPVLDGLALFARHGRKMHPGAPVTCRLPANDEWSKAMLQPLVEAAGYRIAASPDEPANVTILMDDQPVPADVSATVIRLHSDSNQPEGRERGIYRYDRDALLAALKQALAGSVR